MAKKGLPKWAIKEARRRGAKNIFAYAWSLVKRKKRPSRSRKVTKKKNPKRRRKTVARRKKNRKKPGFTLPLSIVAPIFAIPFVPARDGWASPLRDAQKGRWSAVGAHLVNGFQPFMSIMDPTFGTTKWDLHVPRYLAMIIGGVLTHKLAAFLGVNRAIARAKIPFVRV